MLKGRVGWICVEESSIICIDELVDLLIINWKSLTKSAADDFVPLVPGVMMGW